jgi:hypothetical protein
MRVLFCLGALMFAAALVVARMGAPIEHAPGVLVEREPVQGELMEEGTVFQVGDWTLTPLATYQVQARVLAIKRYRSDFNAGLSPYDLLLGWGPMSDSALLDRMSFRQSNRFGYWSHGGGLPVSDAELGRHAANTHVIPANDRVRERIAGLRPGSVVRMRGVLVEATHPQGAGPWRSSLTRDDTGDGACEILYVEAVSEVAGLARRAGISQQSAHEIETGDR